MSKRLASTEGGHAGGPLQLQQQQQQQRQNKRPRLDDNATEPSSSLPPPLLVQSAGELDQLLKFRQDDVGGMRAGIRSFKALLEHIAQAENKASTAKQQSVLAKFLDSQRSASPATPHLPELLQTWSFAAQTNNDSLVSAVCAALALLVRLTSTLIDLRDHGLGICRAVLEPAQLKLMARNLAAPKAKEHIINPSLRLLTEIVAFDGGVLASQVYKARSFTLDPKILSRNLTCWKAVSEDAEEARRRPAIRTMAVRYLLANLKFQSSAAKAELLKYSNVFRTVFEHVRNDHRTILRELLVGLKADVFLDGNISRQSKSSVLHESNLAHIAGLFRQPPQQSDGDQDQTKQPTTLAHEFLTFVCTDSAAGLLRSSSWYPPGTERSMESRQKSSRHATIDLGLDSVEWFDKFRARVPVRNVILAKFALGLKSHASVAESDLLITIFKAAPELVAHYFLEKASFSFDPKLTATWIGYSAFLFSAIQLPVPQRLGPSEQFEGVPPPVSVMLENVLPRALSQQVLTRCLNQKVELITFFAIRLLAVAFQKLQRILSRLQEAARENGVLWRDAAERLKTEFLLRVPTMKDAISTWNSTPASNIVQREATLRLLRYYYQTAPQVALEERLDLSATLTQALDQLSSKDADNNGQENGPGELALQISELNHLLEIARSSPDVRWFSRTNERKLSPFGLLLQILACRESTQIPEQMPRLFASILKEMGTVQFQTSPTGADALLASLALSEEEVVPIEVFAFVDDVLERASKKQIVYEDAMDVVLEMFLSNEAHTRQSISLIWTTIVEQWPFQLTRNKEASHDIARWIGRFAAAARIVGEDSTLVNHFLSDAVGKSTESKASFNVNPAHEAFLRTKLEQTSKPDDEHHNSQNQPAKVAMTTIDVSSFAPPAEHEAHPGLHLWSRQPDLPTAIATGALPPLISCLSSRYAEVREQALVNIRAIMARIKPLLAATTETVPDPNAGTTVLKSSSTAHTFSDATPIYLLLGILSTTCMPFISKSSSSGPVPSIVTSYAAAAAKVLLEPLHPLYDKVNAFHTRSPKWDVSRLASYWTNKVLLEAPSDEVSLSLTTGHSSGSSKGTANQSVLSHDDESEQISLDTSRLDAASSPYSLASHNEIHFLLCVLINSLQCSADVEILRSRGTFEPIMSLASASNWQIMPMGIRQLVLVLIWRVALIDGGATTLVTRYGVLAFVDGLVSGTTSSTGADKRQLEFALLTEPSLKALKDCVLDKCDQTRVAEWTGSLSSLAVSSGLPAEQSTTTTKLVVNGVH